MVPLKPGKRWARGVGLGGVLWALASFSSCQVPAVNSVPTITPNPNVLNLVSANASAQQTTSVTVNIGSSPKHVDLIFTNESSSAASMPSVVGDFVPSVPRAVTVTPMTLSPSPANRAENAPPAIQAANAALARTWRTKVPSRSVISADSAPTTGYTVGVTTQTYIPPTSEASSYPTGTDFTCTLRAVVSAPTLGRTLFVWVADNSWDTVHPDSGNSQGYDYVSGDPYPYKVNTNMVAQLATAFLKGTLATASSSTGVNTVTTVNTGTPGSSDIYGYDTSIYGKEYFDQSDPKFANYANSGLITPQGEIHIFILPLNPTSSTQGNGGVLGYFYNGDNLQFSNESDSNQKIMFQLDSQMLANPSYDGTNSLTNLPAQGWSDRYSTNATTVSYWPNQMLSTLAHEFQHMIHFYQKQVLQNANGGTQTWINEMCSMVTEDFVASSLGTVGPRGVPYTNGEYTYNPGQLWNTTSGTGNDTGSRLAFFNNSYTLGVENWDTNDQLASYGVAYAFGAWLARNYGGPQLFHAIVDSPYTTDQAVVNAVNTVNRFTGSSAVTMAQLVEQWAATMLLGAQADQGMPYELSAPQAVPLYAFNPSPIQNGPGTAQTFHYGSVNPDNYYPISDITNSFTSKTAGPLVYSNLSGVSSLPPLAFYYYALNSGQALSGSVTFQVTLPPQVELQAVVLP